MLRLRILSAVIGAPIFVAMIWLGSTWFAAAITLLVIIGLFEYFLPWPNKNIFPAMWAGIAFGAALPILTIAGYTRFVAPELAILVAVVLIWQIFAPRRVRAGVDAGVTVLGVLYAGLLPSYLISTRLLLHGREFILSAVACVWACDIAAYFVGRLIGRHKLAPDISPHKTIEGAVAGVVAAVAAAAVAAAVGWLSWPQAIALGLLTGVLAQIGDLVASMLKREVGIKDYGTAIPGHGGILDRFDGLFFTAPFVYFLLYFLK
jgi:phosphatidate cytidylyltransferase